MSGSLNKVMLIGNLGDNVKLHHFENGGCIGRFHCNKRVLCHKTSGEKVSSTEWHNIVVKNKAAEICDKYLKKVMFIEGKLGLESGNQRMETNDTQQKYM